MIAEIGPDFPTLTTTLLESAAALERQVQQTAQANQTLTAQLHKADQEAHSLKQDLQIAHQQLRQARVDRHYAVLAIKDLRRAHRNDSHAKATRLFKTALARLAPNGR